MAFRDTLTQDNHGKTPAAQYLADKFADANINFATSAEAPTKTFVDNVITVHNRMLGVPEIRAALQMADHLFGEEDIPF